MHKFWPYANEVWRRVNMHANTQLQKLDKFLRDEGISPDHPDEATVDQVIRVLSARPKKETSPEVSSAAGRVMAWFRANWGSDRDPTLTLPREIAVDMVSVSASAIGQDETKGQG